MSTRRKGRGGSKLFGRPDALLVEEGAVSGAPEALVPDGGLAGEAAPGATPSDPVVPFDTGAIVGPFSPAGDDEELIEAGSGSGGAGLPLPDPAVVGEVGAPAAPVGQASLRVLRGPAPRPAPASIDLPPPTAELLPEAQDDVLALRDLVETSRGGPRVDLGVAEPEWDAGAMETIEADDEDTTHGPVMDSPFAAVRLGVPGRPSDPAPPAGAPATAVETSLGPPAVPVPAPSSPLPLRGRLDGTGRPPPEPTSTLPTQVSPIASPLSRREPATGARRAPPVPLGSRPAPPTAQRGGAVVPLSTMRAPGSPSPGRPPTVPASAASQPKAPAVPPAEPGLGPGAWVAIVLFLGVGAAAAWFWGVPALRGERGVETVAVNVGPTPAPASEPSPSTPPGAEVSTPSPTAPSPTAPSPSPPSPSTPSPSTPSPSTPSPSTTSPPPAPAVAPVEAPPAAAVKAPPEPAPAVTPTPRPAATPVSAPASSMSSRLTTEDPAAATGLIRVKTDRKCLIMVDGRQRGYAPDLGTIELTAGTHVVRAIVQGTGQSRSVEVRVDPGLLRDIEIRWD